MLPHSGKSRTHEVAEAVLSQKPASEPKTDWRNEKIGLYKIREAQNGQDRICWSIGDQQRAQKSCRPLPGEIWASCRWMSFGTGERRGGDQAIH